VGGVDDLSRLLSRRAQFVLVRGVHRPDALGQVELPLSSLGEPPFELCAL